MKQYCCVYKSFGDSIIVRYERLLLERIYYRKKLFGVEGR